MSMLRRPRTAVPALLATLGVLAACTSGSGAVSTAPTSSVPVAASSTSASSTAPSPSASSTSSSAAAVARSCLTLTDDTAIVTCIEPQLTAFWTKRLGRTVTAHVVLDAKAAQVPRACGTDIPTSEFECPNNRTIYFSTPGLKLIDGRFTGASKVYVLAYTLGHETGHVVQDTVHQPTTADVKGLSYNATSQYIEHQADCLSGVALRTMTWLKNPPLDKDILSRLRSISDTSEIATHGRPTVRLAAFDKGLRSGKPAVCHIKVAARA